MPELEYYLSLSVTETSTLLARQLVERGGQVHADTIDFESSLVYRQNRFTRFAGKVGVVRPQIPEVEEQWAGLTMSHDTVKTGVAPIRHARKDLGTTVTAHRQIYDYLGAVDRLRRSDIALAGRVLQVGRRAYRASLLIDGQLAGLVGEPRMQTLTASYQDWKAYKFPIPSSRFDAVLEQVEDTRTFISKIVPQFNEENRLHADTMKADIDALYADLTAQK